MIMDKILFINACVRPCSQTLELAKTLLQRLKGEILEVRLQEMPMVALDLNGLEKRVLCAEWRKKMKKLCKRIITFICRL